MSDKTMADVADKAVDKIVGGVESVARAVEKVAPHVWEVLVRQAFYEGVAGLVLSVGALVLGAATVRFIWKHRKWVHDNDAEPLLMVPAVALVFLLGMGAHEARESFLKLANPQYYAAKQLIDAAAK